MRVAGAEFFPGLVISRRKRRHHVIHRRFFGLPFDPIEYQPVHFHMKSGKAISHFMGGKKRVHLFQRRAEIAFLQYSNHKVSILAYDSPVYDPVSCALPFGAAAAKSFKTVFPKAKKSNGAESGKQFF